MLDLTNEERETTLSMVADDRNTWIVFSDDPVMVARFRRIGAKEVEGRKGETGVHFTLDASQVLLRKGKRKLSDEARAASAERLRAGKLKSTVSSTEGE